MTILTPAKINLTLAVLERRADGYHDLESWVVPIALYDELELSPADAFALELAGAADGVPVDASNLVARAARAYGEAAGRTVNVRIRLTKRIPVGAGLGGGSSDAAATLRGLNALHGEALDAVRLRAMAAAIGSDVTFFLEPRPAILRGRGERIEPLTRSWNGWVALVMPPFGLSTRDVYERHARTARPTIERPSRPWTWDCHSAEALSGALFNDLLPAATACEPRLKPLMDALIQAGGRAVHLTGSGSGLFVLFDTCEEASRWADRARPSLAEGVSLRVTCTLGAVPVDFDG